MGGAFLTTLDFFNGIKKIQYGRRIENKKKLKKKGGLKKWNIFNNKGIPVNLVSNEIINLIGNLC